MADHGKDRRSVTAGGAPGSGAPDGDEALLETFFAAARSEGRPAAAEPPPELLARVLDNAYAAQDGFAAAPAAAMPSAVPSAVPSTMPSAAPATAAAPRRGVLAVLWAAIGGTPGLAGLTAATVAGLWIGLSPPAAVSILASDVFGISAEDSADEALLSYEMAYADLLSDG